MLILALSSINPTCPTCTALSSEYIAGTACRTGYTALRKLLLFLPLLRLAGAPDDTGGFVILLRNLWLAGGNGLPGSLVWHIMAMLMDKFDETSHAIYLARLPP